jgi:hypothetical protein
VVYFSAWRSFAQKPFEQQRIELPIAFYACFNVAVPKSICRPFPACRGFNDPAPLSSSNHIQTNFKPSSHEPSSPYSKFHTWAAILPRIRVVSRQFAAKKVFGFGRVPADC